MKKTEEYLNFYNNLPFELTDAQKKAVRAIEKDLESGYEMNRLVQGDVGSGKTIVSFLASYLSVLNGYQVAIMAPTVVLARQHFEELCLLTETLKLQFKPVFLCGSTKIREKAEIYNQIEAGEANIIIGTNAIISENINYNKLGLVICDEQHRFGVRNRMKLMEKGENVHMLCLSATPIPRTLGIILYGDLSLSTIKDKPKNRLPVKNALVGPEYREKSYKFINDKVKEGEQAYIIVSKVEDGPENDLKSIESYPDEIRPYFDSNVRFGILHGKMKDSEKDSIMESFKEHRIDVLISTTVVEVGVNVPNATVILIENCERFGLASLHQLRGRVGRGDKQSFAIFITGKNVNDKSNRLSILQKTNDGFEIADEDLKSRGPGDFFGVRQSGMPGFKLADIYNDANELRDSREIYDEIITSGNEEIIINAKNVLNIKDDRISI